ncbi:hypothetical protein NM688_g4804 [Phlebia brevispora]|uniref:Uncharacterized protein n=1 Tax=Phlebia brevispora TaxID=194682 RepID=A0ACC1T1L0_9APHY|nr:hypothetical protein NM688_g4804 [Phlebia brevispora]
MRYPQSTPSRSPTPPFSTSEQTLRLDRAQSAVSLSRQSTPGTERHDVGGLAPPVLAQQALAAFSRSVPSCPQLRQPSPWTAQNTGRPQVVHTQSANSLAQRRQSVLNVDFRQTGASLTLRSEQKQESPLVRPVAPRNSVDWALTSGDLSQHPTTALRSYDTRSSAQISQLYSDALVPHTSVSLEEASDVEMIVSRSPLAHFSRDNHSGARQHAVYSDDQDITMPDPPTAVSPHVQSLSPYIPPSSPMETTPLSSLSLQSGGALQLSHLSEERYFASQGDSGVLQLPVSPRSDTEMEFNELIRNMPSFPSELHSLPSSEEHFAVPSSTASDGQLHVSGGLLQSLDSSLLSAVGGRGILGASQEPPPPSTAEAATGMLPRHEVTVPPLQLRGGQEALVTQGGPPSSDAELIAGLSSQQAATQAVTSTGLPPCLGSSQSPSISPGSSQPTSTIESAAGSVPPHATTSAGSAAQIGGEQEAPVFQGPQPPPIAELTGQAAAPAGEEQLRILEEQVRVLQSVVTSLLAAARSQEGLLRAGIAHEEPPAPIAESSTGLNSQRTADWAEGSAGSASQLGYGQEALGSQPTSTAQSAAESTSQQAGSQAITGSALHLGSSHPPSVSPGSSQGLPPTSTIEAAAVSPIPHAATPVGSPGMGGGQETLALQGLQSTSIAESSAGSTFQQVVGQSAALSTSDGQVPTADERLRVSQPSISSRLSQQAADQATPSGSAPQTGGDQGATTASGTSRPEDQPTASSRGSASPSAGARPTQPLPPQRSTVSSDSVPADALGSLFNVVESVNTNLTRMSHNIAQISTNIQTIATQSLGGNGTANVAGTSSVNPGNPSGPSRGSRAKKVKQSGPTKHKAEARNSFLSDVRDHFEYLTGHADLTPNVPAEVVVEPWRVAGWIAGRDGPATSSTPGHFQLDLNGTPSTLFNRSVRDVFTTSFLSSGRYIWNDKDMINDAFDNYFNYLQRRWREQQAQTPHPADATRRQRHYSRRYYLFQRRLDIVRMTPALARHEEILRRLGVNGMSSDESDTGAQPVQYRITTPRWRHPAIRPFLQVLDDLYTLFRLQGGFSNSRQGSIHRHRVPANIQSDGHPVSGLPQNAYNPEWLGSQASFVQGQLAPQPQHYSFTYDPSIHASLAGTGPLNGAGNASGDAAGPSAPVPQPTAGPSQPLQLASTVPQLVASASMAPQPTPGPLAPHAAPVHPAVADSFSEGSSATGSSSTSPTAVPPTASMSERSGPILPSTRADHGESPGPA